jgi:hypothetical protein
MTDVSYFIFRRQVRDDDDVDNEVTYFELLLLVTADSLGLSYIHGLSLIKCGESEKGKKFLFARLLFGDGLRDSANFLLMTPVERTEKRNRTLSETLEIKTS